MLHVRLGILCFGLAAMATAASAQSVDPVVIGVIRDPQGAVVAGAEVTAENELNGHKRTAFSDTEGRYRLPLLSAGNYTFTVKLGGFVEIVRPQQSVTVGATPTIDFRFETVKTASETTVTAGTVLETTKSSTSRLVSREEINDLPLAQRRVAGLAVLSPGVTPTGIYGGVDISGARDFQNAYILDGVSAEGFFQGTPRFAVSQDWIQEFQVISSQPAAEFGGASGGMLNGITRSGTNRQATRAYGYFRDESWGAAPHLAPTTLSLASGAWGATTGGPIRKNRLFYFAGAERLDHDATTVISTSFPAANGLVPVTSDQTLVLGKLDWFRGQDALRIRFNVDRASSTNVAVGGIRTEESGTALEWRATEIAAAWSRIAGAAFHELRAAYSTTSSDTRCNYAQAHPAGPWFGLWYPAAQFGCPESFGWIDSGEFQLISNLSWAGQRHDVKAGAFVSRARSSADYRFLRHGAYVFENDMPFDGANPVSYPIQFNLFDGPTTWSYPRWALGAFVQDSWRLTRSLTINGGLRYDVDFGFAALNDLVRTDDVLNPFSVDVNNVAPRVGIAWTPFDNAGRTLLRGGVGVFYDETHAELSTLLLQIRLADRTAFLHAYRPPLNPFCPRGVPCVGPVLDEAARQLRQFLATALSERRFPDSQGIGPTPDLAPDLQVPFTVQTTVGIVHVLRDGLMISADFVQANGHDQYSYRDVNLDQEPAELGIVRRPNTSYGPISRYENYGEYTYRAMQLRLQTQPRQGRFLQVAYTLAKNEGNTNTALRGLILDAIAVNPFNFEEDRGPSYNDVRHNLSVSGAITMRYGIQVSGILYARSGLPWTVSTTQQLDRDAYVDRPEPRNSRRGDGLTSLDLRFAKHTTIGNDLRVSIFAEVYNAGNAVNFTDYVGSMESAAFGQPTRALEPRRVQLGFRIEF
jgi:hypothetical protein